MATERMKLTTHLPDDKFSNGHDLSNGDAADVLPVKLRPATPPKSRRGAEPFDELLSRLHVRRESESAGPIAVGLVGCEHRSGVTTMAANLAVRASELGLGPVLLVETHRAGNGLLSAWRTHHGPGLAEVAQGSATLGECLRPGPAPELQILHAGSIDKGAVAVWDAAAVESLLAEATADHSFVLFDLPPADRLRQALILARRLDQVLLVVRADSTRKDDAAKMAQRMLDDGVPLSGVILNRQREYVPRWLQRWV
jgi:Mrp family chromosome partitioning ATPase